jgi:hypothetical protein
MKPRFSPLILFFQLTFSDQTVTFNGHATWDYATTEITLSGDMSSSWTHPFNLKWLTVYSADIYVDLNIKQALLKDLKVDTKCFVAFSSSTSATFDVK